MSQGQAQTETPGGTAAPIVSHDFAQLGVEPVASPRFNFWIGVFEGALFMGGMNFVSAQTLLPKLIQDLGGPDWLQSMVPLLGQAGFLISPIVVAHHIERMRNYKRFFMWCGLCQRFAYFIATILLLTMPRNRMVALVAVSAAPLLAGISGGIGLTAWQQLMTKCVSRQRRNSMFAIRAILACVIGVGAGFAVKAVLNHWPKDPFGYGILHGLAFVIIMISYGIFALTREPKDNRPPSPERHDLISNIRSAPALISKDHDYILLLCARFFRNSMFIVMPFLTIRCLDVLGKRESFLGELMIPQMAGAITGNLVASQTGDRYGSKPILYAGMVLFAFMTDWSLTADCVWQWWCIMFLFGAGMWLSDVGNSTIGLEMGPRNRRSTILAVAALVNLPAMLLAAGLGGPVFHKSFVPLAVCTIIGLIIGIIFLAPMRERHDGPPEIVAEKES